MARRVMTHGAALLVARLGRDDPCREEQLVSHPRFGRQTLYDRIYAAVSRVPPGYVTTYGAVGRYVGCPARVVGYALHYLRAASRPDVPWQRVINARGRISTHGNHQRELLESEGVIFEADGRVDLRRYAWPEF